MTPTDEIKSADPPDVPSSTAVTTKSPPGTAPIPVSAITAESPAPPPVRHPALPEENPGILQWTLLVMVAALGFLLASFPAKNPDLWAHLATGKSLAQSGFLTSGAGNPSWLFDVICYELYVVLGGAGLVILKALLICALAVVLLRLSAIRRSWWIPIFCTSLAMLTLGIRLRLQPATVSYLFLGLAFWWLRPREDEKTHLLPRWPLWGLFLVWANLDSWFLLGLLVMALVEVGRILDGRTSIQALVGVCLAAVVCCLNPSLWHVFQLPADIAWIGGGVGSMTTWGGYFETQGITPVGVAYFPLAVLGLLSFALNLPRIPWERLLPWLALAVFAALEVRVVPFFAVIGGPILAWNLFDLAERWKDEPAWRGSVGWGHALTVLAVLALIACSWPGWLQSPPYEPRRWDVELSASLESGAAAMQRWIEEAKLDANAKGLHLSQESFNAFALLCPEEQTVRDEELSKSIRSDTKAAWDWQQRMRDKAIHHVVLYDADRERLLSTMTKLLKDPRQWQLVFIEGYLVVFAWLDPAGAVAVSRSEDQLELDRMAFRRTVAMDAQAPNLELELEERNWYDAFWKPIAPRPKDQDEATLYLRFAEAIRWSAPQRHDIAWERIQAACLVGAAGGWAGPQDIFDAYMRRTFVKPQVPTDPSKFTSLPAPDLLANALKSQFVAQRDDIPPALIYLAIRAARRAIAANPEDAQAYLVLGESYVRLIHATRERLWMQHFPELQQLRRAQASAALNMAIKLKPDFTQAHWALSGLYGDMQYMDLMLEQRKIFFDLYSREPPPAGVKLDAHRERLLDFEDETNRIAKEVERRQSRWEVATAGTPLLDKAAYAAREGLAGQALEMLLDSDISNFGARGMALEVELLLRTGSPEKVRDWTGPEHQVMLSTSSYHWEKAQAFAAMGDYVNARKSIEAVSQTLAMAPGVAKPVEFQEMMSKIIAERVLTEFSGHNSIFDLSRLGFDRAEFLNRISLISKSLQRQADLLVLQGLILLEAGAVKDAVSKFREALSFWKDAQTAASGGGLEFHGRATAQTYLEWMR
jgi:hypothetical protein